MKSFKQLIRKALFLIILFVLSISLFAQNESGNLKNITGTITYKSDNTPLIGVNVVVKGTTRGAISDLDGKYQLKATKGETLVFSYLGMKTIDKKVGDENTLNVVMEDDAFGLEEVVISGVASATPRKNLTVSVESVDADKLKDAHAASAASALQDKVAGLKVIKANGLPGSGAALRLRGSTSLIGNQSPMIMLDGNIISTNLADINLDDIESFEVVKGAAAAALYGSRAGNGVIVLRSKRGKKQKEGHSKVVIRTEMGFQQLAKKLDLATHHPYQLADDWEDYPYTRYANVYYYDGKVISGSRLLTENGYADQPYRKIYDNQDLFYKKGQYHTEYIGIEGNENKSNFLISFENNRQEGILFNTGGYQRNNIKINLDRNITGKLKISTSNLLMKAKSNNPGSYKIFNDLLFMSPDVDLLQKNADSTDYKILPDPWGIAENPLYPLAYRDKTADRTSLIGNVKLSYFFLDWIDANAKYTYEYRDKNWTTITPKGYKVNNGQYKNGSLYKESYNRFDQNFQATINMNKKFNDLISKLKLSYLYENTHYEDYSVLGKDFIFEGIPQLNNTNPELASLNSYQGDIVSINYFFISDFNYKDRYLFSGLYRIDGSSLFGENVRWNPYYRVSGAYRVTEDFEIPFIDELKIRTSYGTSGQRPGFSAQYETWSISNGQASKRSLGNKNLKPSTTNELEIGINMDFLNRFSFEGTYSISDTKDAFAQAPLPSHYGGYPYQWKNVGTISSKALEMKLDMNLIKTNSFSWTSTLLFDRIRQKVTKLDIPAYKTGPLNSFYVKEGESFGIIYGYKWVRSLEEMANQLPEGASISDYVINSDGYVIPVGTEGTVNEIPILVDSDNNGLADKIKIGDGNPDFNLSMGNTFSFKGLNLYFLLAWKNGGNIYNYTRQYTFRDLRAEEFDQFGKPEDQKKTINYYSSFYKNTEINSYFVEDGSFLKLREVSLNYNLNPEFLHFSTGGFIKGINIGIQSLNVFTLTKYKGYDPEVASGSDLTNYPFDNFGYPNFRTYTASLKLTF